MLKVEKVPGKNVYLTNNLKQWGYIYDVFFDLENPKLQFLSEEDIIKYISELKSKETDIDVINSLDICQYKLKDYLNERIYKKRVDKWLVNELAWYKKYQVILKELPDELLLKKYILDQNNLEDKLLMFSMWLWGGVYNIQIKLKSLLYKHKKYWLTEKELNDINILNNFNYRVDITSKSFNIEDNYEKEIFNFLITETSWEESDFMLSKSIRYLDEDHIAMDIDMFNDFIFKMGDKRYLPNKWYYDLPSHCNQIYLDIDWFNSASFTQDITINRQKDIVKHLNTTELLNKLMSEQKQEVEKVADFFAKKNISKVIKKLEKEYWKKRWKIKTRRWKILTESEISFSNWFTLYVFNISKDVIYKVYDNNAKMIREFLWSEFEKEKKEE